MSAMAVEEATANAINETEVRNGHCIAPVAVYKHPIALSYRRL